MKKNGWMALSTMALLAALLFAFAGCAKKVDTTKSTAEMGEGAGMKGSGMGAEELQPIQPKELKNIFFDYDRFDLSPEARATLADNAAWLESNTSVKVVVEGHCDDRGTNEYNIALGDRRAKSAYNYLINLGIDASRLSTISYGEEKPECTEQTDACWSKNRRAQFVAK
ncbi:MAG: peptidoglycan-associated lipoprotein Pal [bacterium]